MYFNKLALLINTSSAKNLTNNFINHHVHQISASKHRHEFLCKVNHWKISLPNFIKYLSFFKKCKNFIIEHKLH